MIRILINGQLPVNNPVGVDSLKEEYKYSNELKIFYTEITGEITFYGADFEYLYTQFKNDSCAQVKVEIQESDSGVGTWYEVFRGFIIAKDVDFDLVKRTAACQIIDDGFMASIVNNADLQIPIRSVFGTTKGGQTLNATVTNNVTIRGTNSDGSNLATGTSIHEAFRYIISWMTDYGVAFESDYFLTDTEVNTYFFGTGLSIRTGSSELPTITFKDFVVDMNKLFHVYGYFYRTPANNLILKFEPYEFFENITAFNEVYKATEIKLRASEDVFFSSIKLGSTRNEGEADFLGVTVDTADNWFIQGLNEYFGGFSNADELIIDNACNKPVSLDLKTRVINTDINTISRIITESDYAEYDLEPFLFQRETEWELIPLFPFDETGSPASPIFGTFNRTIMNKAVLKRWLSEICLNPIENIPFCEAKAELSADVIQTIGTNVPLDVFTDPCGVFLTSSGSRFITTSFRHYNMRIRFEFFNHTGTNQQIFINFRGVGTSNIFTTYPSIEFFAVYDYGFNQDYRTLQDTANGWTGTTVVDNYTAGVTRVFTPGETAFYDVLVPAMYFYQSGQFNLICGISPGSGSTDITIKEGSYMELTNPMKDLIREVQLNQTCDIYPYEHEIKAVISPSEARDIRDNQFKKILIHNSFQNVFGKIKNLSRNIMTGESTLLIKSKTA